MKQGEEWGLLAKSPAWVLLKSLSLHLYPFVPDGEVNGLLSLMWMVWTLEHLKMIEKRTAKLQNTYKLKQPSEQEPSEQELTWYVRGMVANMIAL